MPTAKNWLCARLRRARRPRARCRTSPSSFGSALVRAMIGKKFASVAQRGTTCWCRCAAMPAPAIAPWFMPMLKPSTREVAVSTRIAVWVRAAISAVSCGVASSYRATCRYGHDEQVAAVVREQVQDHVPELAAMHDERLLVAERRRGAEHARVGPIGGAVPARCRRCGAGSTAAGSRPGSRRTGRSTRRRGTPCRRSPSSTPNYRAPVTGRRNGRPVTCASLDLDRRLLDRDRVDRRRGQRRRPSTTFLARDP